MAQTPLLYVGGLSGRVFVATRYRQQGHVDVREKFDVTDQFQSIATELGWTEPDNAAKTTTTETETTNDRQART